MIPQIDEYAHLHSIFHRWDPRPKLIAFITLIIAFSVINSLYLLPLMLAVSGLIFIISRLPFLYLLKRLRLPGFFIIMMALILPFFSGQTVIAQLGGIAVKQEGCMALLLITVKFLSILTIGIVLFGTTPFHTNIKAMRALGLPPLLSDMMFFTYRYIFEIEEKLQIMKIAMKQRGFRSGRLHSLKTLAHLAGTLLVRSHEQSERVYKAMILRGYGQAVKPGGYQGEYMAYVRNYMGLALFLLTASMFVSAQVWLF